MSLCVRSQKDLNSEVVVCSTRGGRGLRNIPVRGSKDLFLWHSVGICRAIKRVFSEWGKVGAFVEGM